MILRTLPFFPTFSPRLPTGAARPLTITLPMQTEEATTMVEDAEVSIEVMIEEISATSLGVEVDLSSLRTVQTTTAPIRRS